MSSYFFYPLVKIIWKSVQSIAENYTVKQTVNKPDRPDGGLYFMIDIKFTVQLNFS